MALSIEALNALTPEQMADKTLDELDAEFGTDDPSELENDNPDNDDVNQEEEEEEEDNPDDDEGESDEEVDPEADENENEEDDPEDTDNADVESENANKGSESESKKSKVKSNEVVDTPEQIATYKSFYEALTKPFTANGQTYNLTDPNDFISLAQKGLNYNLKMNTIKPFMAVGNLLQENNLLDTEKLAFLIDLHNKKPEAIAKLIQESGVDSYELDEEKANSYKPTPVNMPSEEELTLKEVISLNKDNTDFSTVYDAATQWDAKSQDTLISNPTLLEVLAQHKANGVYDKIMDQVNIAINVRGSKTPVIELYDQIGRSMFTANNSNAQAKEDIKVNKTTKVTKRVDPKLEEKRKTLKSVKSTTGNQANANNEIKSEEDIYRLSPEEFAKIDQRLLKGN